MGALHHIIIQYVLYSFFSIVSTIKFNRILQISLYLFSLFFLGLNFVVKIAKNRQIQYFLYYLLQFPKTVNSVFNHCFFSTPPPVYFFIIFVYFEYFFTLHESSLCLCRPLFSAMLSLHFVLHLSPEDKIIYIRFPLAKISLFSNVSSSFFSLLLRCI